MPELISLETQSASADTESSRSLKGTALLLIKLPFFTPWTPPLGIGTLKAFLQRKGCAVTCLDFNTDAKLWDAHHRYFAILTASDRPGHHDGYSKLWWILNAHLLAYLNGASAAECSQVIRTVAPYYRVAVAQDAVQPLLAIVEDFFGRLEGLANSLDFRLFTHVGVSAYTTSLASSLFLLRLARTRSPGIVTIVGGGVFADDLAFGSDNLDHLLHDYPFVDHVVLGEGELPLFHLLTGSLKEKRLISLSDCGGRTLPIEEVPAPDFSDLRPEQYFHLTIEGARSCPFQCSFCSETVQWGQYRKKPVSLLVEQMAHLSRTCGSNTFFMGDSLMNPYINALSEELIRANLNILYDGYLRADKTVGDWKRVKEWARSGLHRVRVGVESASRRVLETMNKVTTPEAISTSIRYLASAGIRPTTYWIAGFPGETEDDFNETLEFIREHHNYIYEMEAHPFLYYPYGQVGSRLYRAESLYPPEINSLLKFEVWDVADCRPGREERYNRLERFSRLAEELGLINIYSMEQRYRAEDRWLARQPTARDMYRTVRKGAAVGSVEPPHLLGIATSHESAHSAAHGGAYLVEVQKPLVIEIAEGSWDEVASHHCIVLQPIRFQDPDTGPEAAMAALCANNDGKAVAGLILASGTSGTRVAVVGLPDGADAASLIILAEDFFRAYEQIAEGLDISLPASPAGLQRSAGFHTESAREDGNANVLPSSVGLTLLPLNRFTGSHGLLQEMLTSAWLNAGQGAQWDGNVIRADLRNWSKDQSRRTGLLTVPLRLPRMQARSGSGNVSDVAERLRGCAGAPVPPSGDDPYALLNLEYITRNAWLGGNQWEPRGLVMDNRGLAPGCAAEITPYASREGVRLRVRARDNASGIDALRQVLCDLPRHWDSALDEVRARDASLGPVAMHSAAGS